MVISGSINLVWRRRRKLVGRLLSYREEKLCEFGGGLVHLEALSRDP